MQLKRTKRQAGDTLIEVLLAFSIFGAAATTITRTMNEGYQQMFTNGQQSQVQALMRGQLAIVQAAHDAEVKNPSSGEWDAIINAIADSDVDDTDTVNANGCAYTQDKNRLWFATGSGGAWTQPQVRPKADPAQLAVVPRTVTPTPENGGVWIEAKYTPPDADSRGFYDFYIKACWSDSRIARQLKTVSRLYDLEPTPGESSPYTPNPPTQNPIPVATILTNGNEWSDCSSITPLEGYEYMTPAPTNPLFSSRHGAYPCGPVGGVAYPNTVYTCTNYDITYPSKVTFAGRYQMTLSYMDALCGGGREILNAQGNYHYRLEVYVNGVRDGAMALNPDAPSSTYTFNHLPAGATIGFRWWNNRFFNQLLIIQKDPDFVFSNIRLDYVQ